MLQDGTRRLKTLPERFRYVPRRFEEHIQESPKKPKFSDILLVFRRFSVVRFVGFLKHATTLRALHTYTKPRPPASTQMALTGPQAIPINPFKTYPKHQESPKYFPPRHSEASEQTPIRITKATDPQPADPPRRHRPLSGSAATAVRPSQS